LEVDFLLGVGVIFALAAALGGAAFKARLSPIVGFMLVGALIGPSGLNLITEGPLLELFADIGIILLLFVVGVEFEISQLSKVGPAILTVGLLQTSLSFFLGYLAGSILGWNTLASMYLGGILMFSSTAIIVKMLHDLGMAKGEEYEASVGVLILQDAMAVVLLIVLLNATTSGGASLQLITLVVAKTLTFIVLSIALGVKLVPLMLDKVAKSKMSEAPLLTALSLAFLLAYIARELGVSEAVGAFTAGLTIAYSPKAKLIRDVVTPLRDFFMTIFFVSMGTLIHVDLHGLIDAALISLPLLALALLGRLIGCSLGGLIGGLSERSSFSVAAMLIPMGEFSFIIAKQGIDLGVLPPSVFPSLMIICIATTIMAPTLIRHLPVKMHKMVEAQPTPIRAMTAFLGRVVGRSFRGIHESHIHLARFKERVKSMLMDTLAIFIALSLLSMLREYVLMLHQLIPQLQLIDREVFMLLVATAVIAYPLLDIFVDADKVVNLLMGHTLARFPRLRRERGRLRRVIRNLSFAILMITLSIILMPGISSAVNLPHLSLITSALITLIVLVLIFDAAYIFNRGLWKAIREALKPHYESALNE